jgi:hypothetical protein
MAFFFSGQIFSIANCNRLPEVFMDFWLHKIQDFSCESADYNIIESDGFYEWWMVNNSNEWLLHD